MHGKTLNKIEQYVYPRPSFWPYCSYVQTESLPKAEWCLSLKIISMSAKMFATDARKNTKQESTIRVSAAKKIEIDTPSKAGTVPVLVSCIGAPSSLHFLKVIFYCRPGHCREGLWRFPVLFKEPLPKTGLVLCKFAQNKIRE